jgi:hypothetical protein
LYVQQAGLELIDPVEVKGKVEDRGNREGGEASAFKEED